MTRKGVMHLLNNLLFFPKLKLIELKGKLRDKWAYKLADNFPSIKTLETLRISIIMCIFINRKCFYR